MIFYLKKDCGSQTATILDQLQKLKNLKRADRDKAYHKSQREHWGVSVPECSRIAIALSKQLSELEILHIAYTLWETQLFDPMICAAKLLTLPKMQPSQALWEAVVAFLQTVDGWALEDSLSHAAWKCILADESLLDEMQRWTKHTNFWMRRAALVYTLPFAKPGRDPEKMLNWASMYSTDPEWFIQKAIGWWLRILGEHNPERVVCFLQTHWVTLKPVAKKEATRKLQASYKALFENYRTHKLGRADPYGVCETPLIRHDI